MNMWLHAKIRTYHLQGLEHQTLADLERGTYTMEVWRQTLAPGMMTPWHHHACEKVVVTLEGRGECRTHDRTEVFGPDATLIVESDALHRITNIGDRPLEFLAILGMTPVAVMDASGHRLELPWEMFVPSE